MLRSVAVVAIPTRELAYPTGQTVALEAAGTGAAVVLTDTPAMREYFSEETAVMVAPGDVDGWQRALTVWRGIPNAEQRWVYAPRIMYTRDSRTFRCGSEFTTFSENVAGCASPVTLWRRPEPLPGAKGLSPYGYSYANRSGNPLEPQ